MNEEGRPDRIDGPEESTADTAADPTENGGAADQTVDIFQTAAVDASVSLQAFVETLAIDPDQLDQIAPMLSLSADDSSTASQLPTLMVKPRSIAEATVPQEQLDSDYQAQQLLGQGGMGTVHLAKQLSLGREVALKRLHEKNRANAKVQDGFLFEATMTGRLEHPNIIPIYDVGQEENGDLFYVMKNIRGLPWTESIGDRSLRENLDILLRVCDAVAFGHAQGIVHRDIKPGNIMIGEFGEVLVLDWGLAVELGDRQKLIATPGGTPAYMAPELLNPPHEIYRQSDIYLLGAILFEILTGKAPHGGKNAKEALLAVAENTIQDYDEQKVVIHDASGELMTIAMKAMASQPTDRHDTVLLFQQEVRGFQAHQESWALSTRAKEELKSAEETRDYTVYSRSVFGYEEALNLWSGNEAAQQGLKEARLSYAHCAEQQGDYDLALSLVDEKDLEQQPMVVRLQTARTEREARKARLRRMKRGLVGAGVAVLLIVSVAAFWINEARKEADSQRAVALQQKGIAEEQRQQAEIAKGDALASAKIARQKEAEATEQRAVALEQKGIAEEQRQQAEIAKGEALASAEIARQKEAEASEQRNQAQQRSEELQQVADFQSEQLAAIDARAMGVGIRALLLEKLDESPRQKRRSEEEQQQARKVLEDSVAGLDFTGLALKTLETQFFENALKAIDNFEEQPLVQAQLMQSVASTLGQVGLFDMASDPQTRALEIRREELGNEHLDTLASIDGMGTLLKRQGKYEEAEPYYREVLETYRKVLGVEHEDTLSAINNMGHILRPLDKHEEAESYFREALEGFRKLGTEHPGTLNSLNSMASLLSHQGEHEEAESCYLEALEGARKTLGEEHHFTLALQRNMGAFLRGQARHEESKLYLLAAVEGYRSVLGAEHPTTLGAINSLGVLLAAQGKSEEAMSFYREALLGYRKVLGDKHPSTLQLISNIGVIRYGQGKYEEAELYLREVLESHQEMRGDAHSATLDAKNNIGSILQKQRKYAEAESYLREALEGFRTLLGDEHRKTLNSVGNLGSLLLKLDKHKEAEPYYREALAGHRKVLGAQHPATLRSINNMGSFLQSQGKYEETEPYFRESLEGFRKLLGDEHPNTLTSLSNMGSILRTQGKYGEAEPYYREALEGFRKVLGGEHPNTLTVMNRMGSVLNSQSRYEEAEPYYREFLEVSHKTLGSEHRTTLGAINNMGELLKSQGKYEEAEPYFREALLGRRKVLGDEHWSTRVSVVAMGSILRTQGKYEEAEQCYRESLEVSREALGDEHPATLDLIDSTGDILINQGKYQEALPLMKELLRFTPADDAKYAERKALLDEIVENLARKTKEKIEP